MNNSPEQIFYIKYNPNDGYVIGQITQKGYDELNNDEQRNYQKVIVDQSHLNGWGDYWNTVRYVNGVLQYPNNWPKNDLKQQINKLSNQVNNLSTFSMQLQLQLAKEMQGGNK